MKFIDILKEEITDQQRKKAESVHKAIRKGIITLKTSGNRYRYELPEEFIFDTRGIYDISIQFVFFNKDIVWVGGGLALPLKVWLIEDGKKDVYINELLTAEDLETICYGDEYHIDSQWGTEYINVKNKVRSKYRNFDINAIMASPMDPTDL